jgi:hypothetical protein
VTSVITAKADIYASLGKTDGRCSVCGATKRRMGWLGRRHEYWLMCDACNHAVERCDCPTLQVAERRIKAEEPK